MAFEQQADRCHQLRALVPAGMALALSLAGDLTLYAVLPVYAVGLGLGLGTLGILLSANRLIRLVTNPLVGWLADRFSRRKMFLTGLTTGIFSTLLYTAARGFWVFLLARVLWGVSWSILYIGIYCMMMDVTGREERGWGSGLLQTFYFIGLAVAPLAGGLLTGRFGFSLGLLFCAAIQSVGLVGALLFLPETHPASGRLPVSLKRSGRAPFGWVKPLLSGRLMRSLPFRKNGQFLSANYLYLLTLFIGDGIIMSTLTLYLKQRYGDGIVLGQGMLPVATAGGMLIALRALVSGGAAPLAGIWSDRSGARWAVAGWAALITLAGCIFLAVDGPFWMIIAGILLASFGSGMLMALLPAIVSSVSTGQPNGVAMGILTTAGDIGCALAPLVSYALLSAISLSQLYLISAGLLVSGVLLIAAITRRGKTVPSYPETGV